MYYKYSRTQKKQLTLALQIPYIGKISHYALWYNSAKVRTILADEDRLGDAFSTSNCRTGTHRDCVVGVRSEICDGYMFIIAFPEKRRLSVSQRASFSDIHVRNLSRQESMHKNNYYTDVN